MKTIMANIWGHKKVHLEHGLKYAKRDSDPLIVLLVPSTTAPKHYSSVQEHSFGKNQTKGCFKDGT